MLQDVDEQVDLDDSCAGAVEGPELPQQVLGVDRGARLPDLVVYHAEVVRAPKLCHREGLKLVLFGHHACRLVVPAYRCLDPSDQVLDVHPVSPGKLLEELVLVDRAHAKLGQHLPQVSKLDELLLVPRASALTALPKPRPEDRLISEELGADQRQHPLVGHLEGSFGSSQVMEPCIEVDDCRVFLVQGQECCEPLYFVGSDVRRLQ